MRSDLITLDGKSLNQTTREGVWKVSTLQGWWDSPRPRAEDTERPFGDGSIPGSITYEPRRITISGRVMAKNHGYMHEAMQALAALSFRKFSDLVVHGHGSTQWASVRIDGQITFVSRTEKYLQFEIPLVAVDPFKYGATETFTASSGSPVYVHHMGTVEAWPVVTVTGNMTGGYTVSVRGQTVTVPTGIFSGETHRIDFRSRRLYINGQVSFGLFNNTNFVPVLPGPRQAVALSGPSGSGTAVFSVTDTFI